MLRGPGAGVRRSHEGEVGVGAGKLRVKSPATGEIVVERAFATASEIDRVLARARTAQHDWRGRSIAERAGFLARFVDAFVTKREAIAEEITLQMGRPIAHSPFEVGGFEERARHMISIAEEALAPIEPAPREGFRRFIRRDPLGVVLTIAPWNYPYLTAVNSIVPALLAGNAVVLRHSSQTPLCAERFAEAFEAAGLPQGVFQIVHASHADTERMIAAPEVDFVAFTGSVDAGRSVQRAAAERFIGVGLELGGKDPAYVRADADVAFAAEQIADGAFFNAGQSCCGIERIYVDSAVYDAFVEGVVEVVRGYRLGDPREPSTTLGPLVKPAAAEFVRGQTAEAIAAGAQPLVDAANFALDAPGRAYLAPQVLVDVDHSMRVMTEESFGPVVGIQRVASDEEAVALMNDSAFGLTASVWTRDEAAAVALGTRVETGTWFMNRCDYLDPALAWTGVKDSGRGCTLSRVGFEALTRPKSFHLRRAEG
jgi:acyl-CoA reductase-like NAD-dependent aldehyde dehydrogenase